MAQQKRKYRAQENESALCLKRPQICTSSQYDEIRVDGMQRFFQMFQTLSLNISANLFQTNWFEQIHLDVCFDAFM